MEGNLVVAHGGGPTAVINSSLYGVITEAKKYPSIKGIYAARYGIEGVLSENFVDLARESDKNIELLPHTPSSAIGSCRRKLTEDDYIKLVEVFKKYNIRYFFYNGGNDSMDTCNKVANLSKQAGYEMRVIGIPKTIDNDLACTDHCPGFGSAARFIAINAMDLAREVQALPAHVLILETMGRNAGWLAASAVFAKRNEESCPQLIYLPEIPFNEEKFLEDVNQWNKRTKGLLVVVSEGLADEKGEMIANLGTTDDFGHKTPGGVAQVLADSIMKNLKIKARAEKPGLVGRASYITQSRIDREEAIGVGRFAVKSAIEGKTGYMVSINRTSNTPYQSDFSLVELDKVANFERKFPLEWINEEGNGIKKEFIDYGLPLLGDPLPEYAAFDYYGVPKV
jgi:6-phosphofructokinase 1